MTTIPLTLLSGYLGAGKTTFLNRILAAPEGQKIAVLVNDFGAIAIDETLIQNENGKTIALTNGCACCEIGDDLYSALDTILKSQTPFDHIVIEASGVADPAKIMQVARAEPDLKQGIVVTIVDVLNFTRQFADPALSDSLVRQIVAADRVVISKTDSCTSDQLETCIEKVLALAPECEVISTPPERPVQILLQQPKPGAKLASPTGNHTAYATWSYEGQAEAELSMFKTICSAPDAGILRLKGFVNNQDGQRFEVQLAGQIWSAKPFPQKGPTSLVAIGLKDRFDPAPLEGIMK